MTANNKPLHLWVGATRPKTLWAAVAPVIIGLTLSYDDGYFDSLVALLTLLCAILIQVGTNFANDYYDGLRGSDKPSDRLGPLRLTQSGLVKPEVMHRAYISIFIIAVILGCYLISIGGWPILVIGFLSILFGILYTSGPLPLAYIGLGDIFVVIFFGPVASTGAYYLQSGYFSSTAIVAGIAPGLLSTALLTVNNLRDRESDALSNKKTLAVRFGGKFAKIEYLLCITGASSIPIILLSQDQHHPYIFIASIIFFLAFPAFKVILSQPVSNELNKVLALTGKLLLMYSIAFMVGWLL
jgi:1,4-dihydroxy-2-naphthoate octaprenyltransferase